MNTPPYIITEKSVTVLLDGQSHTLRVGDSSYLAARDAVIRGDWSAVRNAVDRAKAIENYFGDEGVTVESGIVYYRDEPVHNVVTERILTFMQHGLSVEPLARFLANLMKNPSKRSVEQLYTFLEHKNLPLTERGTFLGYKGVRSNYYSIHSGVKGQLYNGVGCWVTEPRNTVEDNPEVGCAQGLHVGSLEYAREWAGAEGRVVIVEVNPKDVVSVPTDCECQKLRTWKYKVVSDYEKPLDEPLY